MTSSNRSFSPSSALKQEKILAALGSPLRWQMFRMLSNGEPMHSAEVAREFDRDFDGISKHLRILRSAGLLRSRPGADRRIAEYFVPAEFRQTIGEIELGFCLLRVPEARPDSVEKPDKPLPEKPVEAEFKDPEQEPESEPPVQGFGEMLANTTAMGSGREG